MARSRNAFDGPFGGLMALAMERMNREAEAEAVDLLAPGPADHVLVLGFGPGVGVELVAARVGQGRVVGVDPSRAMMKTATRRNRHGIKRGLVDLQQTTADAVTAQVGTFDGAIAVNTLQLCDPVDETSRELARVMKPGARLVSLTHDWAITRHAPSVTDWLARVETAFATHGFVEFKNFPARAEKGKSVAFTARRGS